MATFGNFIANGYISYYSEVILENYSINDRIDEEMMEDVNLRAQFIQIVNQFGIPTAGINLVIFYQVFMEQILAFYHLEEGQVDSTSLPVRRFLFRAYKDLIIASDIVRGITPINDEAQFIMAIDRFNSYSDLFENLNGKDLTEFLEVEHGVIHESSEIKDEYYSIYKYFTSIVLSLNLDINDLGTIATLYQNLLLDLHNYNDDDTDISYEQTLKNFLYEMYINHRQEIAPPAMEFNGGNYYAELCKIAGEADIEQLEDLFIHLALPYMQNWTKRQFCEALARESWQESPLTREDLSTCRLDSLDENEPITFQAYADIARKNLVMVYTGGEEDYIHRKCYNLVHLRNWLRTIGCRGTTGNCADPTTNFNLRLNTLNRNVLEALFTAEPNDIESFRQEFFGDWRFAVMQRPATTETRRFTPRAARGAPVRLSPVRAVPERQIRASAASAAAQRRMR